MADDSITTGQHIAFTVTVGGIPFPVQGKIRRWSVTEEKDEIVEKVIGQDGSYVAHEFVGYSGQFELITSDPTVDDLIDAISAAEGSGTPVVINFSRRIRHRSGGRVHLYRNAKLSFSEASARGEALVYTVTLRSGTRRERIA